MVAGRKVAVGITRGNIMQRRYKINVATREERWSK